LGDEMLLFLKRADPAVVERFGGVPTHSPVALDGVAYIENGRVVAVEANSPVMTPLLGEPMSSVRAALPG
jgi:hypothetical protein